MPIDFSKLNTQPEDLGTKPVDPKTALSFDNLPEVSMPYSPIGQETDIDKKYARLTGAITPALGETYYKRFAAGEQSAIEQFGAFLNQAVIGEVVGGSLEGIGYLTDLKQYYDISTGQEQEFGNWFSDVGKSLRTWSEEATPIYIDPEQKKWAAGHWSWWMSNGKSIASTLSLLIPAAGTVKAVGAAGKALGISTKMAKVGESMGISASRMAWAAEGISSAVVSRHMENIMEASGAREEVYKDMMSLGMSSSEAEEYASTGRSRHAPSAARSGWRRSRSG